MFAKQLEKSYETDVASRTSLHFLSQDFLESNFFFFPSQSMSDSQSVENNVISTIMGGIGKNNRVSDSMSRPSTRTRPQLRPSEPMESRRTNLATWDRRMTVGNRLQIHRVHSILPTDIDRMSISSTELLTTRHFKKREPLSII